MRSAAPAFATAISWWLTVPAMRLPGCLIIAELNGELLARRLLFKGKHPLLGTDNPQSPPCPLREDDSFAVWGVITSVIRKLL